MILAFEKKTGVVIMTALLPTIGHQYLVEFANQFMQYGQDGTLHVIVYSRDREPTSGFHRIAALREQIGEAAHVRFHDHHGEVPQNPGDHPDFWNHWANLIRTKAGEKVDFLFASEMYGVELSKAIGCEFVPCDIDRELFHVRGTDVRSMQIYEFDKILPYFQRRLRKRVTFFGAESCGKTTMSRYMAAYFRSTWVHEWARPYLEKFGPETTLDRMKMISRAQHAAQNGAARTGRLTPFVVQDTDLLSTIGFYKLYFGIVPADDPIDVYHKYSKSDLYIQMNSRIPFEPDPLRYGGTKRETSDQYWTDLLEEYGCKYHVVEATDWEEQVEEVAAVMGELYNNDIAKFVRD